MSKHHISYSRMQFVMLCYLQNAILNKNNLTCGSNVAQYKFTSAFIHKNLVNKLATCAEFILLVNTFQFVCFKKYSGLSFGYSTCYKNPSNDILENIIFKRLAFIFLLKVHTSGGL